MSASLDEVCNLLRHLRSEGYTCERVRVGEIEIDGLSDLRHRTSEASMISAPTNEKTDLLRSFGGEAFEELERLANGPAVANTQGPAVIVMPEAFR